MASFDQFRTRLRPLAFVVGVGWAFSSAGCYSWSVAPTGTGVAPEHQVDMRLTQRDSTYFYLYSARAVGDSLVGTALNGQGAPVPTSIAIAQVRRIEVHEFSPGKTFGAVIGVPVGLAAVLLVIVAVECSSAHNGCWQ